MAQIEGSSRRLLDVVKQMPPEEFDAFIARAMAGRVRSSTSTLSAAETKLIKQINRGLTATFRKRYARLSQRLRKNVLTANEHQELLALTHEAESLDAERSQALLELAKLRRVPVQTLMTQLGIEAAPVHG